MSIFSKLSGSRGADNQKNKKFHELEKQFSLNHEMINITKALWLTSRGNHYGKQGKLDQAIIDFKDAIELKPDHIPAYIALGIAYREKGLFKEALEILYKAPHKLTISGKEISGFEFDLNNAIAAVYLLIGDKLKTTEYAKKALEAVNDPKRKEQMEFAKQAGVISEKEVDDSQVIKVLKELIQELEGK